jgi:TolB-like protein
LLLFWSVAVVAIFGTPLASPFATKARADGASVTVLGVRSLDGEDQLERRVSHSLRNSARGIEGYRVSDREVSLAQMSLAHGCEDVDIACLKDVAATLAADRLIYGNLVRSGDKVRVTLFNFDARSGQIDASAERTVLAAQLIDNSLNEIVLGLTQRLAGKRGNAVGTLRITGNRPGATVALDGKPSGALGPDGELTLAQVPEGPHTVLVETSDGRDRRELSVEVRADTTTSLRALLTQPLPAASAAPESGPVAAPPTAEDKQARNKYLKRVFGWTSVGIAAGFAIATIYTWVRIGNISEDKDLLRYANYYPKKGAGSTKDACKQATHGELAEKKISPTTGQPVTSQQLTDEATSSDLCKEADRLEGLQWVFVGGTVAFAGVGTWLLWSGYREQPVTVSLRPRFGFQAASLDATLRF